MQLSVGSNHHSKAREQMDDPVWRSQLCVVRYGRVWCLKTLDGHVHSGKCREEDGRVGMSKRTPMPTSRMATSRLDSGIFKNA